MTASKAEDDRLSTLVEGAVARALQTQSRNSVGAEPGGQNGGGSSPEAGSPSTMRHSKAPGSPDVDNKHVGNVTNTNFVAK